MYTNRHIHRFIYKRVYALRMSSPRICIKEIAEQKGFDAAKLARRADMSYSTVWSLWNNPHRLNVPLKTLVRIADVLGVEVNDLLRNDKDHPPTDGTGSGSLPEHETGQETGQQDTSGSR